MNEVKLVSQTISNYKEIISLLSLFYYQKVNTQCPRVISTSVSGVPGVPGISGLNGRDGSKGDQGPAGATDDKGPVGPEGLKEAQRLSSRQERLQFDRSNSAAMFAVLKKPIKEKKSNWFYGQQKAGDFRVAEVIISLCIRTTLSHLILLNSKNTYNV